jgi:multidrug efflux system outer membrane protein
MGSGGDTRDLWSASLGSTAYEVDLFGRVRSLNRQALEKFFATDAARKSAMMSLVAEVAAADLDLRRATRQVSLADETLGLVEQSRALNRAAFEAGASNELDLRSADAQVESTRVSLIAARLQATEARNRLEFLLGQPLPDGFRWDGVELEDTLVPRVPSGLPSDLLQRRPDILEAEHNLKAANANIGAARAAFLPTLRLTTSAGTSSDELSKLFGAGTGVWSFSPQLTVPLFTGGENRANLAAARVGVRIEVANYEGAIQRAFREVADTLASIDALEGQSAALAALVLAQQRRFDLARARFSQGEDIYLNVLLAQQDLFTARVRSIDNTYSLLAGRIALFRGLGGGWQ